MRFGTYAKWRIPKKLILYLISVLDHQDEKFSFKREDYAVRNEYVKMIEEKFQKKIDRDCFASQQNALCSAYFTQNENALQKDWNTNETL